MIISAPGVILPPNMTTTKGPKKQLRTEVPWRWPALNKYNEMNDETRLVSDDDADNNLDAMNDETKTVSDEHGAANRISSYFFSF